MNRKRDETDGNKEEKARKILYRESEIEDLTEEFSLSNEAKRAAVLIYRILVGLGKGLNSTQKKSYAALSVRIAAEKVDGEKPLKKELADSIDVSQRTLSRRFKEVTEDQECTVLLEYVEERIREWSRKKEKRLQDIL